jgi:hypothetical protein
MRRHDSPLANRRAAEVRIRIGESAIRIGVCPQAYHPDSIYECAFRRWLGDAEVSPWLIRLYKLSSPLLRQFSRKSMNQRTK